MDHCRGATCVRVCWRRLLEQAAMTPMPPALEVLLGRHSVSSRLLDAPGPSVPDIRLMVSAGLRAPDHWRLRPWRFIQIEGVARVP
jgi:hypothetical protein